MVKVWGGLPISWNNAEILTLSIGGVYPIHTLYATIHPCHDMDFDQNLISIH